MGNKKRISVSVFLFIGVFLASFYFTFIHHPPAAEILANQGEQPSSSVDEFNLDPNVEHSMADISKAAWGKFLYMNKYVAIGDVFDTDCGELKCDCHCFSNKPAYYVRVSFCFGLKNEHILVVHV